MLKNEGISRYDFSELIEDPAKKLVLIIYDIIDNKRRTKMVKMLESYGIRVQKSAFEALLSTKQYKEVLVKILKIADEEDNVRLYRLNSSNEVIYLGDSDTIYEEDLVII